MLLRHPSAALFLLGVLLTACDPEPPPPPPPAPLCVYDDPSGAPPKPTWSEQPNRPATLSYPTASVSSIGSVVACDPANLGSYPVPEGGASDTKGADLQNVSTNFHIVQSIQLLVSALQKAVSKLEDFKTDVNEPFQPGRCLCDGAVSNPNATTLAACRFDDKTREECNDLCDPSVNTALDPSCNSGVGVWLPGDVFKDEQAQKKFALDLVGLLDDLQDFTSSDVYAALQTALTVIGSDLENLNDILTKMSCWADLFTEGYHLGGYSDQRPDLHMCIGWYGHGAYAHFGESGKFDIGGRYTSYNLSEKLRAQMRTGGFAVTAFGKTVSILPGIEFNAQVDGYGIFDACAPLGIDALGDNSNPACTGSSVVPPIYVGSGSPPPGTIDLAELDIFSLVDRADAQELDTDADGILAPGEFIVTTYQPFDYGSGPYTWPRAAVTADHEGDSAAVFSAGVNINPELEPIEKNLGTAYIAPGVAVTPILKLGAGAEWIHEAYKLRSRIIDSINTNLPAAEQLDDSTFLRDMHGLQGPDLTGDNGTKVYVTPEIKLLVSIGIAIGSRIQLGILASLGLGVDLRPGGHGGIVDLSRALTDNLNASNPPQDLPCEPILEQTLTHVCSDTQFDTQDPGSDPDTTYACDPAESQSSCCLTITESGAGSNTESYACIDDFTGITERGCGCEGANLASCVAGLRLHLSAAQHSALEQSLDAGTLVSITGAWNAGKTCEECLDDGTCPIDEAPADPDRSQCEQYGYCAIKGTSPPQITYDVTRPQCAGDFTPYACIPVLEVTEAGWTGAGCHPLNQGYPSACGCAVDADCASGETCLAGHCAVGGSPVPCVCDPDAPGSCPAGRACVEGACAKSCGSCGAFLVCASGVCDTESGVPFAEQIAWQASNLEDPMHAIETYALTDFKLLAYLSAAVKLGIKIRLFGKTREFDVWSWSDAWDLGSTYKSWYQPGLESTYQDACVPEDGVVTNHQPGSLPAPSCSTDNGLVCRYAGPADADWANFDEPHELIAACKDELPDNAVNPAAPTADDFGNAVTDLVDFGVGVGENLWATQRLCIDGKPAEQALLGLSAGDFTTCSYVGAVSGAPASFPCLDMDKFLLETWGCVNTASGLGAVVAGYISGDTTLSAHVPAYLGPALYASSLTDTTVLDPLVMLQDPAQPPSTANLEPTLYANLSSLQRSLVVSWLLGVNTCFDNQQLTDSACECTSAADCGAGEWCNGAGVCITGAGYRAECPFIALGGVEPEPCCGDGVLLAPEQCDDGNTTSGDGCSWDCKREEKGGACCLPNACRDLASPSAAEVCERLGGTLFTAETCAELEDCGHEPVGGCLIENGQCRFPASLSSCDGQHGTFLPGGCPSAPADATAVR